jgi:hypothetical protein
MYRHSDHKLEVFLVHPGGPFWARKDLGAWSIPKGEYSDQEDPLKAAKREFREETGFVAQGNFIHLGELKQPGGKTIAAWAFEGDCDPYSASSEHSGSQREKPAARCPHDRLGRAAADVSEDHGPCRRRSGSGLRCGAAESNSGAASPSRWYYLPPVKRPGHGGAVRRSASA